MSMETTVKTVMNWVNQVLSIVPISYNGVVEHYKSGLTLGISLLVCSRTVKSSGLAGKLYLLASSYVALAAYQCFPDQLECQAAVMLAWVGTKTGVSVAWTDIRNIVNWLTQKVKSTKRKKSKEVMLQYIRDHNPKTEEFLAKFEPYHSTSELFEVMSPGGVYKVKDRLYYENSIDSSF